MLGFFDVFLKVFCFGMIFFEERLSIEILVTNSSFFGWFGISMSPTERVWGGCD